MKWRSTHTSSLLSDEDCIVAYQKDGDLSILSALFERYVTLIFGVCMKHLRNPTDSEDATMEIFELLAQKLKSHQVESFRSWLYILTKNHCLQIIRKRNNGTLTEDYEDHRVYSEAIAHPVEEFEALASEHALKNCLDKLPEAQKRSIELFYYASKSYQEIAELMVIDKEQVRSNIQNGRRNLRICIERHVEKTQT